MTAHTPLLLPAPRSSTLSSGVIDLPQDALIVISEASSFFEARVIQRALADTAGLQWEIVAGRDYPNTGMELVIDGSVGHAQGYELTISDGQPIRIRAADSAGLFYGVCTLRQLLKKYGKQLPGLTIQDWPDFPARGVMLDISRDKVPTLQTVLDLVDRLAGWKINQVQLYIEHTFAYRKHPEVWAEASPFTGEEILELDRYCRERHVELVPNQNSLGHMERWLKFERYLPLAETPEGFEPPWGGHRPASTLNPLDPGSLELIASLYDELLPHFSSRKFNVGGDEPWELGQGKSKAEVEARGGRVYLDYMLKLHQEVTKHGRQMQFWADIIMHHPDLVPELPKDITAMLWWYEGGETPEAEWERQCSTVAGSGVPFYVCPGTSSWNSVAGRTENTIANCRSAAKKGLEHGAIGYLNTDWGDNGHWQPLPVSYLGFAYGAGVSWCFESNQDMDIPAALSAYAFDDEANIVGKVAYDLGNIYREYGAQFFNGSGLVYALQQTKEQIEQLHMPPIEERPALMEKLRGIKAQIDAILKPLDESQMQRADAALIRDEFRQAGGLLRHSADRLLLMLGDEERPPEELQTELRTLVGKQRDNWLARNRPGGLKDSVERFNGILDEYEQFASMSL